MLRTYIKLIFASFDAYEICFTYSDAQACKVTNGSKSRNLTRLAVVAWFASPSAVGSLSPCCRAGGCARRRRLFF
jgi:hypothetical protein